jgi:predicted transcriptional regulator
MRTDEFHGLVYCKKEHGKTSIATISKEIGYRIGGKSTFERLMEKGLIEISAESKSYIYITPKGERIISAIERLVELI